MPALRCRPKVPGKPAYHNGSCAGTTCDDPNVGWHLYTGGKFDQWFGMALGNLDMGRADRAGGRTRARGLDLSPVGRAPLGPVSVVAKAGGTDSCSASCCGATGRAMKSPAASPVLLAAPSEGLSETDYSVVRRRTVGCACAAQ